jgi:hypothetical protein
VSKKGPILKKLAEFISQKLIKEKSKLEKKILCVFRARAAMAEAPGITHTAHDA